MIGVLNYPQGVHMLDFKGFYILSVNHDFAALVP